VLFELVIYHGIYLNPVDDNGLNSVRIKCILFAPRGEMENGFGPLDVFLGHQKGIHLGRYFGI
jgi:hypothetical protein